MPFLEDKIKEHCDQLKDSLQSLKIKYQSESDFDLVKRKLIELEKEVPE